MRKLSFGLILTASSLFHSTIATETEKSAVSQALDAYFQQAKSTRNMSAAVELLEKMESGQREDICREILNIDYLNVAAEYNITGAKASRIRQFCDEKSREFKKKDITVGSLSEERKKIEETKFEKEQSEVGQLGQQEFKEREFTKEQAQVGKLRQKASQFEEAGLKQAAEKAAVAEREAARLKMKEEEAARKQKQAEEEAARLKAEEEEAAAKKAAQEQEALKLNIVNLERKEGQSLESTEKQLQAAQEAVSANIQLIEEKNEPSFLMKIKILRQEEAEASRYQKEAKENYDNLAVAVFGMREDIRDRINRAWANEQDQATPEEFVGNLEKAIAQGTINLSSQSQDTFNTIKDLLANARENYDKGYLALERINRELLELRQ